MRSLSTRIPQPEDIISDLGGSLVIGNVLKVLETIDQVDPELVEVYRQAWVQAMSNEIRHGLIWGNWRLISAALKEQTDYRWNVGYSGNEEARGVDEQESMEWETMRARIRELREKEGIYDEEVS